MRVDFAQIGSARFYYVEQGLVHTWPVSSSAITVRHYDQGGWTTGHDDASADADLPRADERWHDAIELLARLRAVSDDRDWASADKLWERYQARLEQARQAELRDNYDEPDVIRASESY